MSIEAQYDDCPTCKHAWLYHRNNVCFGGDRGHACLCGRVSPPTTKNEGRKDDAGKLRYDLVPVDAFANVVKVLTVGAKDYGDNNWREVSPFEDRYYAALMRHLESWRAGEITDPKSGLPHLAHAACNVLFLLAGKETKT